MSALRKHRGFLVVLAVLVIGGFLAGFLEIEGPGHQGEQHHCITCCTNSHVSALPSQETAKPSVQVVRAPFVVYTLGLSQAFLSPQTPPPKLSL